MVVKINFFFVSGTNIRAGYACAMLSLDWLAFVVPN